MEIQIETIVIVVILLVLFLWATWYRISTWRLKKKYKIELDLGKPNHDGKETRERTRGGIGERRVGADEDPKSTSVGLTSTEGRRILQTATTSDSGKDGESTRKTGRSSRKFLGKFRRR